MQSPTATTAFSYLSGKALITGAASGMGHATAVAYARGGASAVYLADINPVYLPLVAQECRNVASNPTFRAYHRVVDISIETEVIAMVSDAATKMGGINYCCNAAGITDLLAGFADQDTAGWDRTFATNARGLLLCVREELRVMRMQKPGVGLPGRPGERGSIVNIASLAGLVPVPGFGAYGPSKYAAVGLTTNAAATSVNDSIRVNCVCPGAIETPLLINAPGLGSQVTPEGFPPRFGKPEEVADVIVFLSSFHASFISGQAWVVNGAVPIGQTQVWPSGVGNVFGQGEAGAKAA